MSDETEPSIDEVLRGFEVRMGQHVKVRDIVSKAMASAWVLSKKDSSDREKAIGMGKALEKAIDGIMGVFDEGEE